MSLLTAFIGRARRGPFDRPVAVDNAAAYDRVFGARRVDDTLRLAVHQYFANGGRRAVVCRPRSDAFTDQALASRGQGLWALDRGERPDLVGVPPSRLGADADLGLQARAAIARFCETRGVVFLADPPAAWRTAADIGSGTSAVTAAAGHPSANAAVYYPRLRTAWPGASDIVTCVPCGVVAGVIARTDAARGPWKAPAGIDATLTGVTTDGAGVPAVEIDRLAGCGVNAIRALADGTLVLWGARTCQGVDRLGSAWKYLPVRRLVLQIERRLALGLAWTADEPNDEGVWVRVRMHADDLLTAYFRAGAFPGRTPQEAWFVRCDRSTMTQADIDAGRLLVLVGVAPLKPAEFVLTTVTLRARGR